MSSWSCSVARGAVLVGSLAVLAGCGGDEPATPPVAASSATLEADLYSGRVNPSWSLSDEETRGLRTVLDALPAAACPNPPREHLGFRGFAVSGLPSGRVGVEVDCVRVENSDGSQSQRLDAQGNAHRYLADVAAERDPALRPLLAAG